MEIIKTNVENRKQESVTKPN
uniref:Uncharacterized protein n=1 Tax=Rhizophora mucronata TaxID=61149 RepID=A0A2P2P9Y1_RHIMU